MSTQCSSDDRWLSKLRGHLAEEGYSPRTSQRCVVVARHFLNFLAKQDIEVGAATPAHVEHYLLQEEQGYRRRHGHLPDYRGWRPVRTSSVHMLLRLVQGQWPPPSVPATPGEMLQEKIRGEYAGWMSGLRGLSPVTVLDRSREARRFLEWVTERARGEQLADCTLALVNAYVRERAGSLGRRTLSSFATNIRSFLRWLHMAGQTTRELSSAVITPTLHRFEGIPSALRAEDVAKVLAATQPDRTPKGLRDYAILMLLARYGVRAGEITALRLEDVDWRNDVIRIHQSKTDYPSCLPLLPEVGEAVLQYLQKARPKTPFREVFIRCYAPYRPFKDGSSLYGLIQWRLRAAEVVPLGKRGPHAFRHARAVSMLRAAVPVKEIGDVLGHRATDSTLVYLKLAAEDLRSVALEIPTAVRP